MGAGIEHLGGGSASRTPDPDGTQSEIDDLQNINLPSVRVRSQRTGLGFEFSAVPG
jgi:hypothetical protein